MSTTFLLIDDDMDDILLFCEALREIDEEISCTYESNSLKAVETARSLDPTPDLIFLDINMPMEDGWEVLQKLKADRQLSRIPVIMYSTSPLDKDLARARNAGAISFFRKPSDYLELKNSLREIVRSVNTQSGESIADNSSASK